MTRGVPLPPAPLAARIGVRDPEQPLEGYEELGRAIRDEILGVLPSGWSFEGKRVLDFGCGAGRVLRCFLEEAERAELHGCDIDAASVEWLERNLSPPLHIFQSDEAPPLDRPDATFDLVWAISVFTHIADLWALWLLELRRVLDDGGLLIATFLGRGMSEQIAGEPWQEERIGMNVLKHGQSWELGGPMVLHSPWWIREHWGRAFDVVTLREQGFVTDARGSGGHGVVLLRKRPGAMGVEELERIDLGEPRELLALRHNVEQLRRESSEARAYAERLEAALEFHRGRPGWHAEAAVRRVLRALRRGLGTGRR
jgi:SAM-dependent methyltransferase